MPQVFILGGPNGAGKSTAAGMLLPHYVRVAHFVNADQIAQGLSAFDPESVAMEAGRIMLARLKALGEERVDFAFETTLASRSFVAWLRELRGEGYFVHLLYLWLPSSEYATHRVALRVRTGGHNVPEEVVRRRYARGWVNFLELYLPLADHWEVYENSKMQPCKIASGGSELPITVFAPDVWQVINEGPK